MSLPCRGGCGFFGSKDPPHLCSRCSQEALARACSAAQGCAQDEGYGTLLKLLQNVRKGGDPKYRKIRLSNKAISAVWGNSGLRGLLEGVGFCVADDDHAELVGEKGAEVDLALQLLGVSPSPEPGAGAAQAGGRATQGGKPPIATRPSVCAVCSTHVSKYEGWGGSGTAFFMHARAGWEGCVCETCYEERGTWYVICGECYNNSAHCDCDVPHPQDHVFAPMGYTVADEDAGFGGGFSGGGMPAPPPPSGGNRRGPWG
mmetsp:Transcript_8071/g.20050  ORF Transcript_8071/g.20050 Transcript_8071/m.20050 type:complete len:259 (-) Transcript_8071:255-1031(-)